MIKKLIARLRKGKVYKTSGSNPNPSNPQQIKPTKRIEAVSETQGSGPAKSRGKVVGRGDFTNRNNIDRAIEQLKDGVRTNNHNLRMPDGSVEDLDEEE